MNKQNRLILIDGSAYIFRAYYGLPPMNRPDGTPINAVFGFTNMLVKLIEDYRDEKMIVVFDAARENFRNKIFKEYKANRGETPEDLIPQFEIIRECVDAFKIPQIEIEGFEADDIIATYCKLAIKDKMESVIVSSDKDLMQLVNKNVSMFDPMKNKKIGIDQVIEKFGLPPEKVVQIQALTGDKVDNIPGAPGIGAKIAAALLTEFGSIQKLYASLDKVPDMKLRGAKKVYDILLRHRDDIDLYRRITGIACDIPIKVTLEDLRIKPQPIEEIKEFFDEMAFSKRIRDRLGQA